MSGLSRDILKWIQSLDLSYAIKNVRRDFSNGFLIAEILSRYYRADITMHSYDHGTAVSKKSQNWALLEKFFARQGWPIEKSTIQGVIHCDQGSAVQLIEQLYTILTHKTVPTMHPLKSVEYIPPYAQPTTSILIRDRLRKSDMNDREQVPDLTTTILTTQRVITEHNHALRMDKTMDPIRYQPKERRESVGKKEKEKIASPKPTATIKQVTVKQADVGTTIIPTSTTLTTQMAAMTVTPVVEKRTCIQLMDGVVASRLEGHEAREKFDPRLPLSISFVDHITSFSDDIISDLFADLLHSCVQEMAGLCLTDPKEFWQITGIWWKAVHSLDASSLAFREVLYVISSLGAHMLERDITTPFALLSDFLLPKIIDLITSQADKLAPVISMLYAYVMDDVDEHVRVMTRLRDGIRDTSVVIKCFATLLQLENEFSPSNLDLYLNYINIGLDDASPSIRAVSLSMLASIAVKQRIDGAAIVVGMLDRIQPSRLGSDWIVQAQLCHLLTALLTQPSVISSPDTCTSIYTMLSSILHKDAHPLVLRAGLASLTRCLGTHPIMRHLFVDMLHQRSDIRSILLQEKKNVEENQNEIDVHCPKIRRLWHPLSVTQAVEEHVKSGSEQNLLPVHIDLLSSTLSSLPSFPTAELSVWITLFDNMRDEIIVELSDDNMCRGARMILDVYMREIQTQEHAKQLLVPIGDEAPRLYGIMSYIFPGASTATQVNFITMLEEWSNTPSLACTPLIARLLTNFARAEPAAFASNTALQSLLTRVSA